MRIEQRTNFEFLVFTILCILLHFMAIHLTLQVVIEELLHTRVMS